MAKKILLIEYEPRYLDRVRGYLAGKDFDLVVAKDGDEGLQLFQSSRPDLVLVSSVLPKLRTSDVIKGIHAHPAPPPIIVMMSGYKGTDRKADAHRVGAASILEKPFTEESFHAELASALAGAAPAQALREFAGAGPLLSSDDIFSDVLSGMDEDRSGGMPAAAPARGGTDAGIQKRLEQTLSGILATSKKTPAPMPVAQPPAPDLSSLLGAAGTVPEKAMRVEPPPPAAEPKPAPKPAPRSDASVDKLLTDTLSGLKAPARPAPEPRPVPEPKPAPEPKSSPRVPALDLAGIESALGRGPTASRPHAAAPAAPAAPAASAAPSAPVAAPAPKAPSAGTAAATASAAPSGAVAPIRTVAPAKGDFGRYSLLERIAAGGMAEVYKARMRGEEGFEKIVAIKRILPHMADSEDFVTMFIDEAKLAAQLTHNNIIHIYDLGKVDAYHYIAMEYVEGKDLRTIVKMGRERGFPLPVELALLVASKVANALDYAHRRVGLDGREMGLVHRDVSPQNILISMEGDIKLCDFGIAKATTNMAQTQSGALKGKLQYMSPEQAWGKKLDRRSDIFSLGLVLYEMLTGEKLFRGDTDLSILDAVREGRVKPPSEKNPDVSARIDQVVLRALAKEPNDRYQNASEFEKDVNAVLYSFQPAPGPADLAIHMHRLLEATHELSDEKIDAAFAQVAAVEKGTGGSAPKKGKGLVISKKSAVVAASTTPGSQPGAAVTQAAKPAAPEPRSAVPADTSSSSSGVSGAALPAEQGKSRAGLYAGIGLAAAVLVGGGIYLSRGSGSSSGAKAPSGTAAVPAAPASPASATGAAPSTEPAKVIDQKALEAEVKKQAAAEADRLRKEAAAAAAAAKGQPAAVKPGSPAVPAPAPASAAAVPAVPAAAAPAVAAAPVPTAAPVRPTPEPPKVAEAAPKPAPAEAAAAAASIPAPPPVPPSAGPAKEGDLVGPGAGVVEPKLVKLGSYMLGPQAKQVAMKRGESALGTVVIMALVSEKGAISETRVVRKSSYPFVDEAALTALKGATIEPATKDGVRVKMYKAFPITVKP